MRTSSIVAICGTALACSGSPFMGVSSADAGGAPANGGQSAVGMARAGSGGNLAAGAPPLPATGGNMLAAAGASAGDSQGEGGATAAVPEPPVGGAGGGTGGTTGGGTTTAGTSGAANMPGCGSEEGGERRLEYFPELRDQRTQEIHPFFRLSNSGVAVTLDRLKIRYYFSQESTQPEAAVCYWVTGDHCQLVDFAFHDVTVPTRTATRYLEISFPNASRVTLGFEPLEVRVGFGAGDTTVLQTNDYSFDPSAAAGQFPYKAWLRATLYLDGKLVWGQEPCGSERDLATL